MHRRLVVTLLALVAFATAGPLRAQLPAAYLAGTVRDSATRMPVPGAVVSVLDPGGAISARRLSNARGEYRIPLGGGDTRVRVIRIGFEPRDVALPARTKGDERLDITLLALATMMRSVRVVANANCPHRPDTEGALGLWRQAQDALLATVVARQQNPAAVVRLLSERVFDGNSDRIRVLHVRVDSSVDTISFVAARSAQDFVLHGFRHDSADRRMYFGPDATVLLSDAFATSYCFRIDSAGALRRDQVGIHFAPAVRRGNRTDIDGTLWIDTVARELRDVDFRYLGVPSANEPYEPGGRVAFATMRNGIILVDSWMIRSVNVVTRERMGILHGVFQPTIQTTRSAVEIGGQVARAAWPDGLRWSAPLGALRARAFMPDGKPAVGIRIGLEGTPYFGITDSAGTVTIGDLVPGPYSAQIAEPWLDSLHLTFPSPLVFSAIADSTTEGSLTVPTLGSFVRDACVAAHQPVRDSVYVFGRVMTADDTPVANATVTFAARSQGVVRHLPEYLVTGADGLFESCAGWNLGDEIMVNVSRHDAKDVTVTRRFDSRIAIVRVDAAP